MSTITRTYISTARYLIIALAAVLLYRVLYIEQQSTSNLEYFDKSPDMSFSGKARSVAKIVKAIEQSEGAGAKVRRSIGTSQLRNFSPFLMLDHFRVPIGAGFPDHPHRGQETVTYMLEGTFEHEDFAGHAGQISAGDLQWMSAGKGIVHSEMPLQTSDVIPVGLQLWVDLPAASKLCEPRYQELKDEDIPRAQPDHLVNVKVISGESYGVVSPIQTVVGVWYLDIHIQPEGTLRQPLPSGWNSFLYTLSGTIDINGQKINAYNTVVLDSEGEGLDVKCHGNESARFVLIAGEPLDQEVVQYGPFVMDTKQGIQNALADYQMKTNGFERAASWKSRIGAHMM